MCVMSELFVSVLVWQFFSDGIFVVVIWKGVVEVGVIFIVVD